jgi:hypothetical protein
MTIRRKKKIKRIRRNDMALTIWIILLKSTSSMSHPLENLIEGHAHQSATHAGIK